MIDYIINIFTKPTYLWSFVDSLIVSALFILSVILVVVIVYGIGCIVEKIEKKKNKERK